ncbi:MAG: M48 family metallopeptidase [Bacteroidia bacterium]
MRFLTLLFLVSFSLPCFSQNNELLRSRGTLPKNIIGTRQQQSNHEINRIKTKNEIVSNDQRVLIDGTVNLCQAIAKSGRLMINDTLSSYANRILDILLKDNPALRKELCVYFYYSPGSNAVTLDNGMIIIELGLMAHVKNEAQLAFILAHEVCHYRESHFLKSLRYAKDLTEEEDPLQAVLNYSRELEQEADSLGFEMYKSSGYALSEAVTVFDMLGASEMAEEQISFTPRVFEEGFYRFPPDYLLDSLFAVENTDYDEKASTHPSCENRKNKMQSLTKDLNSEGRLFLFPEDVFKALRLLAREECCTLFLEERRYGEAIYCAYVLLVEDSTSITAKKIIGKGLYNIAAYSISFLPVIVPENFIVDIDQDHDFDLSSTRSFAPIDYYGFIPGESQQLHHFLASLNSGEITVLAMRWNWKLYSDGNFKDETESRICENLFLLLTAYHGLEVADFDFPAIAERNKDKKLDSLITKGKSLDYKKEFRDYQTGKFQKNDFKSIIKTSPGYETKIAEYSYRGFDSIIRDSIFFNHFERREGSKRLPFEYPEDIWERSEKQRKSTYGLGITTMCIVQPDYYSLKEIKRTRTYLYNEQASNVMQQAQQTALITSSNATKKTYFMLSPQTLDSTRTADYNTYCMLQQWLEEQTSHSSNALALNLAHAELVDSLVKRLGTQYVMLSSIACEKQKRIRDVGRFILPCLIPFTLPFAVIYGVIPRNRSQMECYVYDLKSGALVLVYEDYTKSKAQATTMTTYYNSVFRKIARNKRPD